MITVTEKRFQEYHKDDIAVTLRNRSGTYGGGQRGTGYIFYSPTVGALQARDWKGIGNQYVFGDQKLVIQVVEDERREYE